MGFRASDSGTFAVVGAKRERDLSDPQNEHVRRLVRELLKREGETQVKLAPKLGLKQPALSGFLAGRQGTSFSAARRAAHLAGVDVDDVLAGRSLVPDPYPARSRALTFASAEVHPDAVAFVRKMEPKDGESIDALTWMKMLIFWDAEARAGRLP